MGTLGGDTGTLGGFTGNSGGGEVRVGGVMARRRIPATFAKAFRIGGPKERGADVGADVGV